jgi:hypothetical protein
MALQQVLLREFQMSYVQLARSGIGVFLCCLAGSIPATAQSVQDASFCDRLDQAMAATSSDDPQSAVVTDALKGFGPSSASCAFSLDLSGQESANCNWAFSYRSEEAQNQFQDMLATLSACADPAFGIESDQPVNHPDFYDLRMLHIVGGNVGLSLKDKVALQQTYVFLRLTPNR